MTACILVLLSLTLLSLSVYCGTLDSATGPIRRHADWVGVVSWILGLGCAALALSWPLGVYSVLLYLISWVIQLHFTRL